MTKYYALKQQLSSLQENEWEATFQEIEDILNFPLPPSAYQYQAWWANQAPGHSQTSAWKDAGWRTERLNLEARRVTFVRAQKSSYRASKYTIAVPSESVPLDPAAKAPLTIMQAKAGLAAAFGVSIEDIEITIRG